MVAAASAAAVVDLCAAFVALEILPFLDPQLGADPPLVAQAALLDSVVELVLPLAALGALFTAVVAIYRHLRHTPAGAGAGNRRLWEPPFAILCTSAATLHLLFSVQPPPAGVVGGVIGAQARALALAAARVLPAAAAATFFVGMALIVVAHIRAGGEGGGGRVAAAVDGQIPGPVLFLTRAAYAAAAALALLTAMALCVCGGDTAIFNSADEKNLEEVLAGWQSSSTRRQDSSWDVGMSWHCV